MKLSRNNHKRWMKIITPTGDYDIFISEKERQKLIKKYPWMTVLQGEDGES